MQIIVRKGRKDDLPDVLELIRELALFEKAPDEVTNTLTEMEKDGFGENPVFQILVAEVENVVVAMAVYFLKYSTWKGKGVYLEDIVVKEKFRGKGIGKKLMEEVIRQSRAIGAKQLHWQVLDWNEPAISFYKKYQASIEFEWLNCKLNEKQLNSF